MKARNAVILRDQAQHSELGIVFYTVTIEHNDDNTWTAYGHAFGYIHPYPVSHVGPWHYDTLDEAMLDVAGTAVAQLTERINAELSESQSVHSRRTRYQHTLRNAQMEEMR